MAMPIKRRFIGIDVSKKELAICLGADKPLLILSNTKQEIGRWVKGLPGNACLALEATNTFHLEVLEQAHHRGLTVYVVDGFRLSRYRDSLGGRVKNDSSDARLLLRYVEKEHAELRPWSPPCDGYRAIQQLLHRRATLVKAKVALKQSLSGISELEEAFERLLREIHQLDLQIQRRMRQTIREHGWRDDVRRCSAIEGIGFLNAVALVMAFRRGDFKSSDAFVAFIGLDVRVKESGTYKGKRRLTKKGDPEIRRLLHTAAMAAQSSATWAPFYQRCLQRGFSKIQALVALARKLARTAFALLKQQTLYRQNAQIEVAHAA